MKTDAILENSVMGCGRNSRHRHLFLLDKATSNPAYLIDNPTLGIVNFSTAVALKLRVCVLQIRHLLSISLGTLRHELHRLDAEFGGAHRSAFSTCKIRNRAGEDPVNAQITTRNTKEYRAKKDPENSPTGGTQ